MKKLVGVVSLVFAGTVVGCATPGPVVRLYPQDQDTVWLEGRGIMTRTTPIARVAVAFDHMAEDTVALRAEVQNQSSQRFDVDPAWMSYVKCYAPNRCGPSFRSQDPERLLAEMDLQQSELRASQKNTVALGTALVLLDAVGVVASVGSGHPGKAAHFADSAVDTAVLTDNAVARQENQINVIESGKVNWGGTALRRTTLQPEQGVAGFVYLPIDERVASVFFDVALGQEKVRFPFKQVLISPTPPEMAEASRPRR